MRPNRSYWACALFTLVAGVGVFRLVTANHEIMARGLAVYQTYYCGACHQLEAAGSKGVFGPPHNAMGVIAQARVVDPNYTGRATTAEEYLIESILDPKAYIVPGYATSPHRMPAYTGLSEEELSALVQFLFSQ